MAWNPEQYHKFQAERFAPFEDLVRLVQARDGLTVIDLGCGTGELTRRLADKLPDSKVLGVDSSPQMLAKAQSQAREGLEFELRPIESISGQWDLVFSNAAIQWVDDHDRLIPKLISLVKPGGQLVVQLPSNQRHRTHTFVIETAGEEPFRSALNGWSRDFPVLKVEDYAELLYKHAGPPFTIFERVYPHVLPDSDALAEWMSGTAITPYFERLPKELHASFLERYREKLRKVWPEKPVFFGFNRILFATNPPAQAC